MATSQVKNPKSITVVYLADETMSEEQTREQLRLNAPSGMQINSISFEHGQSGNTH